MLSAGYNPTTKALDIEFPSRLVYRYRPVPPGKFAGLIKAESKGVYFNSHIKDRYPYVLLRA
jgi:hypothetical protein